MSAPWTDEERSWAVECLKAGDTYEEVAAWSGRSEADVRQNVPAPGRPLTARENLALALHHSGASLSEVGIEVCPSSRSPRSYGWDLLKRAQAKGWPLRLRSREARHAQA